MAHTRELRVQCYTDYCSKQAVLEVYNNKNSPMGLFCRKHGEKYAENLRKQSY